MQLEPITVNVALQLTPEAEQVMQRVERAINYFNKDTGPALVFRTQAEADAAMALLDHVRAAGWSLIINLENDGYPTTADLMRAYQNVSAK